MARSAGGVRKVTTSHTIVVPVTAKIRARWPEISRPPRRAKKKPSAMTKELIIAAISLHALMRHQNQRSR